MEIDHKLHHIIVEPWQESKTKRWKAQVAIFLPSSASGSHPIERPEFDQHFASEHESESAAIVFARDWIDAGKPNLISQD